MLTTGLQKMLTKKAAELREQASERRGGAWTTGLCVVGKDMETGIDQAQSVIMRFNLNSPKSAEQQCKQLAAELRRQANSYSGHDSEGYVAGTIVEFAVAVERYCAEGGGE